MVPLILVVMALAGLGLYQLKASQKPAPTLLTNEKERFHEPVLAPGDRDLWNSSNAATPNVPPRALPAAVAPIVQPVSVSPAPPSPVSVQSPVSVAPAPPSATETASKIPRAGARQGPGPRLEPLASHSSAQAVVERCLEDTSATCSYTDDCPPMDRECLRAFIPFGTPYERVCALRGSARGRPSALPPRPTAGTRRSPLFVLTHLCEHGSSFGIRAQVTMTSEADRAFD